MKYGDKGNMDRYVVRISDMEEDRRTDGWTDGRTNEQADGRTDGWTGSRTGELTDEGQMI